MLSSTPEPASPTPTPSPSSASPTPTPLPTQLFLNPGFEDEDVSPWIVSNLVNVDVPNSFRQLGGARSGLYAFKFVGTSSALPFSVSFSQTAQVQVGRSYKLSISPKSAIAGDCEVQIFFNDQRRFSSNPGSAGYGQSSITGVGLSTTGSAKLGITANCRTGGVLSGVYFDDLTLTLQ
jgi:hypothetical protein